MHHEHFPDTHHDLTSNTLFGFWIYLITDFVLFATVFTTYAVLHNNVAGGAKGFEIFSLSFALGETLVLLFSSFTCGIGMHFIRQDKEKTLGWFSFTFLLGWLFLFLEMKEFTTLIQEGNGWEKSGFLSSYFTLVGLHGLHILGGLLLLFFFLTQLYREGLSLRVRRRLTCFSLFWYFSYIIWICVFTIVYLIGAIQ